MLTKQYSQSEKYFHKLRHIEEEENDSQGSTRYLPYMGYVKLKLGKTEEGQALMRAFKDSVFQHKVVDLSRTLGYSTCVDIARLFAWENKKDQALAWLEKSVENGTEWYSASNLLWLVSDPFFDDIREDERFKKVLQRFMVEEEYRSQLLREKLTEYHDRNELKWIPLK
jgi:hypothetical protein